MESQGKVKKSRGKVREFCVKNLTDTLSYLHHLKNSVFDQWSPFLGWITRKYEARLHSRFIEFRIMQGNDMPNRSDRVTYENWRKFDLITKILPDKKFFQFVSTKARQKLAKFWLGEEKFCPLILSPIRYKP